MEKEQAHVICEQQWSEYRRLRWQAFFGWLFGSYLGRYPVDVSRFFYFVFHHQLWLRLYWTLYALAAALAFTVLITTWRRFGNFKCPRCNARFHAPGPRYFDTARWFIFTNRKCRTCGLRKYSCDEGKAPETLY